jgi:hypothetical protein
MVAMVMVDYSSAYQGQTPNGEVVIPQASYSRHLAMGLSLWILVVCTSLSVARAISKKILKTMVI